MDVSGLRALRQQLGVSQALLAKQVGVDRVRLSLWETGGNMTPEEIRRVDDFLQGELQVRLRELAGMQRQEASA